MSIDRPVSSIVRCVVVFSVILIGSVQSSRAEIPVPDAGASDAAKHEFFEKRIRPLLVDKCVSCHGASKQQGGVRLDSRQSMLDDGDAGPVIAPGQVDESRLIDVVLYSADDVQMPPKAKLADEEIAALKAWIRIGAPWPEAVQLSAGGVPARPALAEVRKSHWSLQPLTAVRPPEVDNLPADATAIDRWIVAKLRDNGLTLSPEADRRTLIRRLTFDLHGLPPTFEETEEFVNDGDPNAYARLVDRLLASPRYGERWGRHWLDVARYADNKGYVFTEETRYPFSYTYRDYVIRAFNEDLPYDRFIMEQLAADQLDLGEDNRALAALGFLTVGARFRNNIHDIIDDRIDVVTRGLLGLTVTCTRCHDHKYDPIDMSDYYGLYGIFASSVEPKELPRIGTPPDSPGYREYQAELAKREGAVENHRNSTHATIEKELRSDVGKYLTALLRQFKRGGPAPANATWQPRRQAGVQWIEELKRPESKTDPIFALWHALVAVKDDGFAEKAQEQIELAQGPEKATLLNSRVLAAFVAKPPRTVLEVAETYGEIFNSVDAAWQALKKENPEVQGLPDPADEALRQFLYKRPGPVTVPRDQVSRFFRRNERDKERKLIREIENLRVSSPHAPPRAMVVADAPKPRDAVVFLRGNPARRGPAAPRRTPRMAGRPDAKPFTNGSGRLQLAEAIADPANPLTARVWVNRVWMHHFGTPLVNTPSNFGVQSQVPVHLELLNDLAGRFIDSGWSTKQLHREMVLSAVYRQSSEQRADGNAADPENRLYWRMNRRRREFESLRDTLLAVSGELDFKMGGKPENLVGNANMRRRTVYGFVDRFNMPGLFRVFDFPNPDASSPQRARTTVPQQALFGMNSEFVIARARALAKRSRSDNQVDTSASIRSVYRNALQREPTRDEMALAEQFLKTERGDTAQGDNAESLSAWEQLAQVLLMTNELTFVD